MKTKIGFNLRQICGENVIIAEAEENIDFSNIISMNESSAYLWNSIQGKDFEVKDLVDLLIEMYEVDEETATRDARLLVDQWKQAEIIE